jgi:hypothetical protein
MTVKVEFWGPGLKKRKKRKRKRMEYGFQAAE